MAFLLMGVPNPEVDYKQFAEDQQAAPACSPDRGEGFRAAVAGNAPDNRQPLTDLVVGNAPILAEFRLPAIRIAT